MFRQKGWSVPWHQLSRDSIVLAKHACLCTQKHSQRVAEHKSEVVKKVGNGKKATLGIFSTGQYRQPLLIEIDCDKNTQKDFSLHAR